MASAVVVRSRARPRAPVHDGERVIALTHRLAPATPCALGTGRNRAQAGPIPAHRETPRGAEWRAFERRLRCMTTTSANRIPKALFLDDDSTVLRVLGTALEARGFDVRAATDGDAGLGLLLDELLDLDVLVVDLDLPGRDARALLHLVRWAGGERDLGVVVLAARADREVRRELLAFGADAVVDRRVGHAVALATIAAVASRRLSPARRLVAAARPALEGALLLARNALSPAPQLARSAA